MNKLQYQIIQYQPDKVSGEFANVGLVGFDLKTNEVFAETINKISRISGFFPEIDSNYLHNHLSQVKFVIKKYNNNFIFLKEKGQITPIEQLTSIVYPDDSSSIKFSEPRQILCNNTKKTFNDLYFSLVSRFEKIHVRKTINDEDIQREVIQSFQSENLAGKIQHYTVQTSFDEFQFDHALKNGKWHCYQPLSLDFVKPGDIKEKILRWSGRLADFKLAQNDDFNLYLFTAFPNVESSGIKRELIKEKLKESFYEDRLVLVDHVETNAFVKSHCAQLFHNHN